MRGFMCAIGLGRLFRRSAATTTTSTASTMNRNFCMQSLRHGEASVAFDARRSSCYNSSAERPQFLFFCGSDTSASLPAASPNGCSLYLRLATRSNPTPDQPIIDHRMPVFFKPSLSPACPAVSAEFV
ncbi:unnamed protein product [Peronospora belbahrii]|uniref:Secreted protein n=1 Tax=Peronospora belbahrii TaxID=622444 RepID=A0AAU9L5C3_9STRA|nr:unnamed protein product [Peronospora belbahrii]CAH0516013.1 unnamed protein product [Peronospora belbahrii]